MEIPHRVALPSLVFGERQAGQDLEVWIVNRLRVAIQRVRISRKLEIMQEEVLKISRKKYKQARISSRDRLQAANAALLARGSRLRAEAEHATALRAQEAAEGSLLKWAGVSP